jgi:hypothetical protein
MEEGNELDNTQSHKTGFLRDDNGNKSSMRLMSMLVFFLLVMIDYLVLERGYYKNQQYDWFFVTFFIGVNLVFLVAAFFPKYLQKIIEMGAAKFQNAKENVQKVLPGGN